MLEKTTTLNSMTYFKITEQQHKGKKIGETVTTVLEL